MKTVLQIIEEAGGLATFTWTRIENPPFMLLVIESLGESGPTATAPCRSPLRRAERRRNERSEICAEVVVENEQQSSGRTTPQ